MADEAQTNPRLQLAVVSPQLEDCLPPGRCPSLKITQTRAMRLARGLLKPVLPVRTEHAVLGCLPEVKGRAA